jgi:hypothetical protein
MLDSQILEDGKKFILLCVWGNKTSPEAQCTTFHSKLVRLTLPNIDTLLLIMFLYGWSAFSFP